MLGAAVALLTMAQQPIHSVGATPSKRQLAWHAHQLYAFTHFGPNTFTAKEWGTGLEDPKVFNPPQVDTDQWCKTFKDAGLTGVIITAKHHDGFCLWPSKYSKHTIAASPYKNGKGDVLKQLSASCKKYGLWMGVYLSPWDRNHPAYGTDKYNDVFVNMLTEVLSNYGPIKEVWFDGANGEGPNGKKQVYDWPRFVATVRKLQPDACIFSDAGPDVRWVGNEAGHSDPTCWCTLDADKFVPGTSLSDQLTQGHENGKYWVPAECDVSIRRGWFWKESENNTVKPPETLLNLYLWSCGQNANFLLNVPPNNQGKIDAPDVASLMGFKKLRDALTAHPVKPVSSNATKLLTDDNIRSFWEFSSSKMYVDYFFDDPAKVSFVRLQEPVELGQRIKKWRLVAQTAEGQKEVANGTTIGYQRLLKFDPVTCTSLRLIIEDTKSTALLATFQVYQ